MTKRPKDAEALLRRWQLLAPPGEPTADRAIGHRAWFQLAVAIEAYALPPTKAVHSFDGGDECLNCGNPWENGVCVLNGCESDE